MSHVRDCRDRTNEFFATVSSFQKQLEALNKPLNVDGDTVAPLLAPSPIYHRTQFTKAAAHISKGICIVAQKLEKLTQLARQRSLYQDPAQEINKLTYTVKSDLTTLNTEINTLDEWVHDHVKASTANKQSKENSDTIVQNLKSHLATTTKSFAEILSLRTKNLKEQNSRRKEYESSDSRSWRKRTVNFRLQDAEPTREESPSKGTDFQGNQEGQSLSETQSQSQIQEQSQDLQDDYLQSRALAVEQIEKTILELGEMYHRLVEIIGQQDELVLIIDTKTEETVEHVSKGHVELLEYFKSVANGSSLIMKIFLVIILFAVFFIVCL